MKRRIKWFAVFVVFKILLAYLSNVKILTMKHRYIAKITLLIGTLVYMQTTHAQVVTYDYTGTAVDYVVPAGVTSIRIDAAGAQGGNGSGGIGGLGATMSGTFTVTPGETLTVIVGQQGSLHYNAGGGGGRTGVLRDLSPLIRLASKKREYYS